MLIHFGVFCTGALPFLALAWFQQHIQEVNVYVDGFNAGAAFGDAWSETKSGRYPSKRIDLSTYQPRAGARVAAGCSVSTASG